MSPDPKSRPDFSKDSSYGRSYARAHRRLLIGSLVAVLSGALLPFVITHSTCLALAYFGYILVAGSAYKWGLRTALIIGSVLVAVNSMLSLPYVEDATQLQWSALSTTIAFVALSLAFGGVGRVATDLRQIRFSDQLRGITGRETFLFLLEKELARVKRYHQTSSLAIVELGIVDKVEKAHGHHQADLLLRQFQMTLGRQVRKSDTLALIGGPYVALLLPNTNTDGAEIAMERLRSLGPEILAHSSLRLRGDVSDWRVAFSELDGDDWDASTTMNRVASSLGPTVPSRIGFSNNKHPGVPLTSIPRITPVVRQHSSQIPQASAVLRAN